jgi:hypothetical protein
MAAKRKSIETWPDAPDPVLALALEELRWYEGTRDRARRWHRVSEVSSLAAASITVVAAGLQAPPAATAAAAGAAVFLNGFRQIFKPGERWVLAAQSWAALRQAVNRYRLLDEQDRDRTARQELLSRIEEVSENEISGWASHRQDGLLSGTNPTPPGV